MKNLGMVFRSVGINTLKVPCVGIVLCENEVGEISCRLGLVFDDDPGSHYSADRIMKTGGSLAACEAVGFFPQYEEMIVKKWKGGY